MNLEENQVRDQTEETVLVIMEIWSPWRLEGLEGCMEETTDTTLTPVYGITREVECDQKEK